MSGSAAKVDQATSAAPKERNAAPGSVALLPLGPAAELLAWQHSAGNRAVHGLVQRGLPRAVQSVLDSEGQQLEPTLRAQMENRFGTDFSQVRIHADAQAATSAIAMSANAYTVGQDVVFAANRYAPDTRSGKRLLAHELAHVVQQSRGGAEPDPLGNAGLESEASRAAASVDTGTSAVSVAGASRPGVMREASSEAQPAAPPREIYHAPVTGHESQDDVKRMFAARGIYFRGNATWVPAGDGGYWHLQDWQVIARDSGKTLNMRADPIQGPSSGRKVPAKPAMTKESIKQKREEDWQAAQAGMWDTAVDTLAMGYPLIVPPSVQKNVTDALKSGPPKPTGNYARDRELQENYEAGGTVTDTVVLASSFVPIGEIAQGARLVAGKAPALVGTGNLGGGKLIGFTEQWAAEARLATKAEQASMAEGKALTSPLKEVPFKPAPADVGDAAFKARRSRDVENAMRANMRNTIGAGGEASAVASAHTTTTDLNAVMSNFPQIDTASRETFASVKAFSVHEPLAPKTIARYDRELRALRTAVEPGVPTKLGQAAEALAANREALQSAGTWPKGLARNAGPEEIGRFINREGVLAIPADHVGPVTQAVAERARANPAAYGLTPGPGLEEGIKRLTQRVQSIGLTSEEIMAINNKVWGKP
jgi:hypothetical protein